MEEAEGYSDPSAPLLQQGETRAAEESCESSRHLLQQCEHISEAGCGGTAVMNGDASRKEAQSFRYNTDPATYKQVICGLLISFPFALACILAGMLLQYQILPFDPSRYSNGNLRMTLNPPWIREAFLLFLNLTFVKFSVWSSGRAHETALKWKLASEIDRLTKKPRLEFNTNIRFLQSSYDWWSANGLPANVVAALCLTITYAASSMVLLGMETENGGYDAIVSFVALYVLGFAVLLHSAVAAYAIYSTEIRTWDQSPFATAAALYFNDILQRRPGRCMHALCDLHHEGSIQPREVQESLWVSHPQFRQVTMYVWMIVVAGYYWALLIWAMVKSGIQGSHPGDDWGLVPSSTSNSSNPFLGSDDTGSMNFKWEGEAPTSGVLLGLGILVGFQGSMITMISTCFDSITRVAIDERIWRKASSERGADHSVSWIEKMFMSIYPIELFVAEPALHWLFGLAVGVSADTGLQIRPVQILYVSLAGTAGAIQLSIAGNRRHRTKQPSTYGHLQTLVDLIDEWPETNKLMYWGHKSPGHAGTSDNPELVEPIHMGEYYGFCDRKGC